MRVVSGLFTTTLASMLVMGCSGPQATSNQDGNSDPVRAPKIEKPDTPNAKASTASKAAPKVKGKEKPAEYDPFELNPIRDDPPGPNR